ncbi:MAG: LysM peptidoglycan-binding domain-containing protein [Sedimenticolaceae bacterium]
MQTPVTSVAEVLVRAHLEILYPEGVPDPIIPLRFNPTQYQVQKANTFAEVPIPGLDTPPIQYVRGGAETLSTEVLVDTSDTLEDVRKRYTDRLQGLMYLNSELHAPPIVALVWDREVFRGVVESLDVAFLLFDPEGIPLRAKLNMKLKAYRPVEVQVKESPKNSPDVDKGHQLRRGDTLSSLAGQVYNDPGRWREIARANGIQDPRSLPPGTRLRLPRST